MLICCQSCLSGSWQWVRSVPEEEFSPCSRYNTLTRNGVPPPKGRSGGQGWPGSWQPLLVPQMPWDAQEKPLSQALHPSPWLMAAVCVCSPTVTLQYVQDRSNPSLLFPKADTKEIKECKRKSKTRLPVLFCPFFS